MYDPFHPTDGDKEAKMEVEEGEGEKYDPFDPTGSPASDIDEKTEKVKLEPQSEDEEEKEDDPPDSTDTLNDVSSPILGTQLPVVRRVGCRRTKSGERRDHVGSDNSEIEEGEIVGVVDRDASSKRAAGETISLNSPTVSFFGSKPERILRVLDGDGFVSVCAEGSWEVDHEPEDEPVVGVEDLRRKLVSKRKERYLSFPASSSLSPQQPPPPIHPPDSPAPPITPPAEKDAQNHKSESSKDQDGQKSKDRKTGEKEEKRKKRKKDKERGSEKSKEKKREHTTGKEVKQRRSSRSSSRKRKKRRHSSPDVSRSVNSSGRAGQIRRSFSNMSEERHREKERDKDRDRDRNRDRERGREREREREREQDYSQRRDDRDRGSSSRKDRERKDKHYSSSTERGRSKSSRRSKEKRECDRERQRDRDWRRDGRPVVPPSIQDLNGADLFAIKRTITVTTTTTTTTVPGSPRLTPTSPCRPPQDSDKSHKRKKKRKWHSPRETDERRRLSRSKSQSLSPPLYHSYESDRYSDKLEIDMLSLDGEALDSDYPSLEDTPPSAPPPEPPAPSPKSKTAPKPSRHHPKKKSRTLKKISQNESHSSNRSKNKCLSSMMVTSESASVSSGLASVKRSKKVAKDKDGNKNRRKDPSRSGKSKKESGNSRKGKLQSKVSVLVRDGVSSTTGASVGSGKLGMDLLGSGGTGTGAGGSVVGGSIAVVFCRDNESRSPFLKPCSEPLSLTGRSKDLSSIGKRSSLATPPSSLNSPAALKSKKTKPSSITSTSSSASSPSSSLAIKRRRRLVKKTREKGGSTVSPAVDGSQKNAEGWTSASLDIKSSANDGCKAVSPLTSQAVPAPCSSSSSSSSISALPPSSSPPHTPPPAMPPLRDTRDSSPDSQTVDSSCKTPEPCFLAEDCPSQTSPTLLPSSPSSLSNPQGTGLGIALSTSTIKPPPPDDNPKSLVSPSCSSSSAGCGLASLSLPPSSADPSSSVSSTSVSKPPLPPPTTASALPWSLQTGVDCTTGGVLALTALLFKMEEANITSRAKAQEFIQATNQILSQANQNQSHEAPPSAASSSSQIPPPSIPPPPPPPPGLSPTQFILHGSHPLVGCTKTPPSHLHQSLSGGWEQTPPPVMPLGLSGGSSGDTGWDSETKDPDKYLKKLHTQERAVEEVKLAIKPYYQRKDINKDEYKDILRKAVHKICHSRTGEINPVKVSNLVKLYVQRYKYFRKHGRKMDDDERNDAEMGMMHS